MNFPPFSERFQMQASFLRELDKVLVTIANEFKQNSTEVFVYADATNGAYEYNLPPGRLAVEKTYYITKTDASANPVNVTAYGTDTIQGASVFPLGGQYDKAAFRFRAGVWYYFYTA